MEHQPLRPSKILFLDPSPSHNFNLRLLTILCRTLSTTRVPALPTTPCPVFNTIPNQCRPSSASRSSKFATRTPLQLPTVPSLKQRVRLPKQPNVVPLIQQTSPPLQLYLLPVPALARLPLPPILPQDPARPALLPRQLLLLWLLSETTEVVPSLLELLPFSVSYSKHFAPPHFFEVPCDGPGCRRRHDLSHEPLRRFAYIVFVFQRVFF